MHDSSIILPAQPDAFHPGYLEIGGLPQDGGTLRIDNGIAWGETFDSANGTLNFNGTGLEITPIVMAKGPGRTRGSASMLLRGR